MSQGNSKHALLIVTKTKSIEKYVAFIFVVASPFPSPPPPVPHRLTIFVFICLFLVFRFPPLFCSPAVPTEGFYVCGVRAGRDTRDALDTP